MLKKLLLPVALFACAGYALASFLVLLFNHWYFAEYYWLKVGCLTPLATAGLIGATFSPWRRLWLMLGGYWVLTYLIAAYYAGGLDLRELHFTAVLDYEAAVVWVSVLAICAYSVWAKLRQAGQGVAAQHAVDAQLKLRRRLRRVAKHANAVLGGVLLAGVLLHPVLAQDAPPPPAEGADYGFAPAGTDTEPQRVFPNRHGELVDAQQRLSPAGPPLPGVYPTPAHLRARELFGIIIENKRDGAISVVQIGPQSCNYAPVWGAWSDPQIVGHVLAPVTQVNPKGFTASGWAEPGTVCASAVNAIHLKTDHNYNDGRGVIFSLTPIEFAEFNPKDYKSYFNKSSTLFTDIPAGSEIFGGQWAPLVGSKLYRYAGGDSTTLEPLPKGYVPAEGDTLVVIVQRRQYNPEWIEFENSFGGLIWVKELTLDPYPIGQVLKPVAGVGRFLGSQYADIGRIRAAHPGVLCISTSPLGVIGGFQIIPRDHAMSPEMTFARVKTQWMVVGPLYALDPSWEGLPPLFTDYFYPAFNPAFNPDGSINEHVQGAAAFLDRFTVKARYSDAADPQAYQVLQEADGLNNIALKTLTHLRIYFPRG